MDGIAYTWDYSGNLLSDGVYTYTYDAANRLVGVSGAGLAVSYSYNGLGDRLSETANELTTQYTMDLNAGLTQVLQDGTNTYLYGAGRIAQYGASGAEYFLGDALGSVRQLVDADGNLTLGRKYKPYGELLIAAGDGATSYGFTNEWTDDSTGDVYLRARWYAPSQGRFLTKDVWEGDYMRPMSFNGWNYVESNPVNFTDPSGLIPIKSSEPPDGRDLTSWLYAELSANANGYYAQRINTMLNSSDLTTKARAVFGWIYLVKNKAKWDSKRQIKKVTSGESVTLHSSKGLVWYEYSVPGNIHYGFVGRAAGFSGTTLHTGAGYAEITDPAHVELGEACCPQICKDIVDDPLITVNICIPLGCYYINPSWANTMFDDPGDYWNVEFGIRLYDIYRSQISYKQFQDYLALNSGWLTPAPEIPSTRFFISAWPYSVGYFDGPDTIKNKPIVDLLLWRSPLGD
jgi:RHS repeat-associated protein